MRKLKLQVHMSLDGFIAGPKGEGDWIWIGERDDAGIQKVIDLAETCDTILMGRKMSGDFIPYWESTADSQPDNRLAHLMVNMRKIVFSRTQKSIKGRNVAVENGDVATAVQALKKEPGKDIVVYGGADFVSSLISQNLIDEYYIIINPVALGAGLPIFKERRIFRLESSVIFKNGKMWNKYMPV